MHLYRYNLWFTYELNGGYIIRLPLIPESESSESSDDDIEYDDEDEEENEEDDEDDIICPTCEQFYCICDPG